MKIALDSICTGGVKQKLFGTRRQFVLEIAETGFKYQMDLKMDVMTEITMTETGAKGTVQQPRLVILVQKVLSYMLG